jgi:hypothetical protein
VTRPDVSTQVRFRKQEEIEKGAAKLRADGFTGGEDPHLLPVLPAGPVALQRRRGRHGEADYIVVEMAVTLVSSPQTATPVEVQDTRRVAWVVVQTEKGLYFLTGAKHVPPAGSKVVVQTNQRWDLFLCAEDGSRCMSIHSFCADAVWPNLQRDGKGRMEACFAPRALDTPLPEPSTLKPLTAVPGGVGKSKRLPPAVGLSHPREWAWRMGLPVQPR